MLSIWQDRVTLQTFADHEGAKGYAEIKHGTLADLEVWARERNKNGFGIYVTVNETDGTGRKVENITGVRTYYTDIDGIPTEEQKNAKAYDLLVAPMPPSAIIKTRSGLHAYWYSTPGQPVDPEAFKHTIKGVADRFGGDARVSDISRVLRLPGYQHLKNPSDPYKVEVIWEDPGLVYTQDELQRAYPVPKPRTTPPLPRAARDYIRSGDNSQSDWELVLGALADWNAPDGAKHGVLMLALGVALKFGVPEARAVSDLIPIVSTWNVREDPATSVRKRAAWAFSSGKPTTVAGLRNAGVRVPRLSRPEST